jgi:hypothetical protein
MKNSYIIILVLIVTLGVSLYFNFRNNETSPKNSTYQQISFEKKQDCSNYRKQIEDKFEKNNNSDLAVEYYYFDRIFYSPVEDSCLYVYTVQFGLKATDRFKMIYLEDFLSGEILTRATIIQGGVYDGNNEFAFNSRVREYETIK